MAKYVQTTFDIKSSKYVSVMFSLMKWQGYFTQMLRNFLIRHNHLASAITLQLVKQLMYNTTVT